MPSMEMCGTCSATVQARLQLKGHPIVLILLFLIGNITFGVLSIPVWLLTFYVLFTIEGICPFCGSFLFDVYFYSSKLNIGDMIFIYKRLRSPIWVLVLFILVLFLPTMILDELMIINMFWTDPKTDFINRIIDRSEFQEKFLQSDSPKGLFDGPINTFHRSYTNGTFNFTCKRHLGLYLGDERTDRLWCKKISLSSRDSPVPDFVICFYSPNGDIAKCDFNGEKEVPVVAGCAISSVGMWKNVTYVKCMYGWVAPVIRGVFQCKDDRAYFL